MPNLDHRASAQTYAAFYGVAVGTIYRWVSEDGIRAYGTPRRRLYRLGDIQAACDRRHAAEYDVNVA
jgi:hypothetical protein